MSSIDIAIFSISITRIDVYTCLMQSIDVALYKENFLIRKQDLTQARFNIY